MIHFAQMVQSQKMQKYDFKDEETNKNRYLSVTPPEIELENVTVPIVAFYGTEDDLSTVEDAEWALGKEWAGQLRTGRPRTRGRTNVNVQIDCQMLLKGWNWMDLTTWTFYGGLERLLTYMPKLSIL